VAGSCLAVQVAEALSFTEAWPQRLPRRGRSEHSSFSTGRRRRLGVNLALTLDPPARSPALAGWSAMRGVICGALICCAGDEKVRPLPVIDR
jgi:hypothetical protein